jgi:hypothetical protein
VTLAPAQRTFERIDDARAVLHCDRHAIEHDLDRALLGSKACLLDRDGPACFKCASKTKPLEQVAKRRTRHAPGHEGKADERRTPAAGAQERRKDRCRGLPLDALAASAAEQR